MNMLKNLNRVLKITATVAVASAWAASAYAEDVELTGEYGNYLKPDCYWIDAGTSTGGGGGTAVTAQTSVLLCPTATPGTLEGEASKTTVNTYSYGNLVSTNCNLQAGAANAQGTCAAHIIYK